MSGLFGSKDNSAAERQIDESKKENERLRKQAEEERRQLAEQQAGQIRASSRGGNRALLSAARVNPEEGITTLGTSSYTNQA